MALISTDKKKLDIDYIFEVLSKTYWAHSRSIDEIKESINNSLCFGMYIDGKQMGFARVVTDKVVFSYLMDVFIDERFRGQNFGSELIDKIYHHKDLVNVKNHYLHTKDAQEFYKKHGFEIYGFPFKFMIKTLQ